MSVNGVNPVGGSGDEELKKKKAVNPDATSASETINMTQAGGKKDDKPLTEEEFIRNFLQGQYTDETTGVKANLQDNNPENDTYTFKPEGENFNIKGLSVTYTKNAQNPNEYDYNAEVIYQDTPQSNTSDVTKIDEETAKEIRTFMRNVSDPRPAVREAAKKELKDMVEETYGKLLIEDEHLGKRPLTDKELDQLANSMLRNAEAESEFEHREIFIDRGKYNKARKELKKEQAEAQKRIDKAVGLGKEPAEEDLNIMRKNLKYLEWNDPARKYIRHHKDVFYGEDGEFSSDKYKKFAKQLAGNDYTLTVQERKDKGNQFLINADKETRAAYERIVAARANGKQPSEYDLKLYNDATRKKFDDDYFAREICIKAGLSVDTDIEKIAKLVGLGVSVTGTIAGMALIKNAFRTVSSSGAEVFTQSGGNGSTFAWGTSNAHSWSDVKTYMNLGEALGGAGLTAFSQGAGIALGNVRNGENNTLGFANEVNQPEERKVTYNGTFTDPCPPEGNNDDIIVDACMEEDKEEACEVVPFDIGFKKTKKTKTVNGKTVPVYEARQMWQFWDSWRVDDGKGGLRKLTAEERKAFMTEYTKTEMDGKQSFTTKEQKIKKCVTIGGVTFTFDDDYYKKQKPVEYTMTGKATSTTRSDKKDATKYYYTGHVELAGKIFNNSKRHNSRAAAEAELNSMIDADTTLTAVQKAAAKAKVKTAVDCRDKQTGQKC